MRKIIHFVLDGLLSLLAYIFLGISIGIALSALLTLAKAYAHPVDDPCLPGQVTEDGCQPLVPELCLDDPKFFRAHKAYWHERRELVTKDTVPYAILVGEAQAEYRHCKYKEGIVFPHIDHGLLTYWDRVPAHPELDFKCAVWRAEEQTEAGRATRGAAALLKERLVRETAAMVADCKIKPKKRKPRR